MTARWRRLRRCDGGFLTIWILGLCLLVLTIGGVSLDLWRVFSERQALAGLVDAAAVSGAAGVDSASARVGTVRLDAAEATRRAQASIDAQQDRGSLVSSSIVVSQGGSQITVEADGQVRLILLGLLVGDRPIGFHVQSTALARGSR